jgi:hypothetical protein
VPKLDLLGKHLLLRGRLVASGAAPGRQNEAEDEENRRG